MPRLMSVSMTKQAVIERRKTVTRRKGWLHAEPGMRLTLCEKVMGRRKGEPLIRVAEVQILSARREPLGLVLPTWGDPAYGVAEMILEGFPGLDPAEFIRCYFTEPQGITARDDITRVEWVYLDA